MDQSSLVSSLGDLPIPAIRFFDRLDSTNDEAWRWVELGAQHGSLVVADEQSAGRGRAHRHWVTSAGTGLALSLVLRSPLLDPRSLSRLAGLGALAVSQALRSLYSLPAMVKWPNDILLEQRKTGGVLVESRWEGHDLKAVVIGIGINVAPESLSPDVLPIQGLSFPATCVEAALGRQVDRMVLLHAVLQEFFQWQPRLASASFIQAWQESLAYRGQWVELVEEQVRLTPGAEVKIPQITTGKVMGLAEDGSLILLTRAHDLITAQVGEIHLRPLDISPPD